jgi:hypothetical protein
MGDLPSPDGCSFAMRTKPAALFGFLDATVVVGLAA